MAPPCVATVFEGDNGGATAKGVTATEIAVAVPVGGLAAEYRTATQALFEFFNLRFELYGRRLRPNFVPFGSISTPTAGRAVAADVAGRAPFAALGGIPEWYDAHTSFFQELGRQQVITVARGAGYLLSDRTLFDAAHPYLWSTQTSVEDWERNVADLTCRSLAGHPAANAAPGAPDRVFGIVAMNSQDVPSTRILEDGLSACGVAPVSPRVSWAASQGSASLQTAMQAYKAAGVTTILCVCGGSNVFSPMSAAKAAQFQPEWVVQPTLDDTDESSYQYVVPAFAPGPVIQVSSGPRLLPHQAQPWFQAMLATNADPLGNAATKSSTTSIGQLLYDELLLLASGIQAAGPALTAESFGAGLMATEFPNPGSGAAPYWQPSAGFGPGDHALADDYSVAWWNSSPTLAPFAPQSQPGGGSWCYVQRGARYRVGSYPAELGREVLDPAAPCR